MAARLKDKDINFYKAFYRKPEKPKKKSKNRFIPVVLVLLVIAFGSAYGYLRYRDYQLRRDLENIQAYTKGSDNLESYRRAQDDESKLDRIREKADNLAGITRALKSYPALTGDKFAVFEACSGADIVTHGITYDQSSAGLSFTATAASADKLPAYIQRLLSTDVFSNVTYSGYTVNAEGYYNCAITCTLKAGV